MDDPGWRPALKYLWKGLALPYRSKKQQDSPNLLQLRGIYLAFLVMQFGYLLAVLLIPRLGEKVVPLEIAGAAAGVAGVGSLVMGRSIGLRFIDIASQEKLAELFRATFFLRYANAAFPVLIGFVGFFLTGGEVWVFLIGFVFSLGGLALMAPTRSEISRLESSLRERGSNLSLHQALTSTDPDSMP